MCTSGVHRCGLQDVRDIFPCYCARSQLSGQGLLSVAGYEELRAVGRAVFVQKHTAWRFKTHFTVTYVAHGYWWIFLSTMHVWMFPAQLLVPRIRLLCHNQARLWRRNYQVAVNHN